MFKTLTVIISIISTSKAFSDTYINMCNKGDIGTSITEALESKDCSNISVEKLKLIETHSIYSYSRKPSVIPTDAFKGLSSLKTLIFSNSQVTQIMPNAFRGLNLLTTLIIEGSSHDYEQGRNTVLPIITSDAFKHLNSLKHLSLNYQDITTIEPNAFLNLAHLVELDLNYNKLKNIKPSVFQGLKSLKSLYLSNLYDELSLDFFDNITNLEVLFVTGSMTYLDTDAFIKLTSLKYLKLDGKISVIHPNAFRGLKNLLELSLSGNNITSIPTDTFQGLNSLTHLNIGGRASLNLDDVTRLTLVSTGGFNGLPSLKFLNLINSKLSFFSRSNVGLNNTAQVYGAKVDP